jgi:hypothetical protein
MCKGVPSSVMHEHDSSSWHYDPALQPGTTPTLTCHWVRHAGQRSVVRVLSGAIEPRRGVVGHPVVACGVVYKYGAIFMNDNEALVRVNNYNLPRRFGKKGNIVRCFVARESTAGPVACSVRRWLEKNKRLPNCHATSFARSALSAQRSTLKSLPHSLP